MTSVEFPHEPARLAAPPRATKRSIAQRALLGLGVLSSLLYVATDVLGGLRYPGYSFASQAISELGAIGAPSESLVDPLFLAYDVFVLIFGVGVLREGVGRSRALRIAGALLIGYGAIGLAAAVGIAGPGFFKMHQRGTGTPGSDAPHIILTGVLVLLALLAIGFAAFALGGRFRIYSFATLATVIAFGAATVPYASRLAAGRPTPGFGIVERIDVYALMLWLAVLSVALVRRPRRGERGALP